MNYPITVNACRVCLAEQEIMINLFDTVEDFQRQRLSDLLETCTDIKVDKSDGQPKLICDECTGELLVVAKFHEKCKRTLEILERLQHTVDENMLKDDTQTVDSLDEEKKLIEMDDPDGIIVEDLDADKDDVAETDEAEQTDEGLMFEEVGFVEEDMNSDQYILFEPGEVEKELTSEEFIKKEMEFEEESDKNVDEQVTPPERKKSNRTTVVPRPLIINCICDACGAGFTHFNNLTRHIYTHNPDEIFVCNICKHPFTTSIALKNHGAEHKHDRDIIENDLEDINCEEHDLIVSEKSDGLSEIKGILNGEIEKPYNPTDKPRKSKICNICNKRFVSKSALEAHMRTHTGDRPFKCDLCSKAFKTQGGLVLHLRRHSGVRPYTCAVCNKGFGESSNLRVHMRTHTGEKPHKCTICDRSFTRVFLLQIHQRTHTGERPYQCPYCERAFTQGGDLASHKRTHTGERPHVCIFCSKGFIKSSGLTQHMRKHMNHEMKSIGASYQSMDKKESKNYDFRLLMVKESGNESDEADYKDSLKVDDYVIDCSQDIES